MPNPEFVEHVCGVNRDVGDDEVGADQKPGHVVPWGRHTSKRAPSKPDKRLRLCRAEPRAGASFALWLRATQELASYWRSMWRPPDQGSRVPERFQPFREYPAAHAEI